MNFLRLICNHGKELLPPSALAVLTEQDGTSFDWRIIRACSKVCQVCGGEVEQEDICGLQSKYPEADTSRSFCVTCALERQGDTSESREAYSQVKSRDTVLTESAISKLASNVMPPSAKVKSLLKNLHKEQATDNGGRPFKR